MPINVLLKPGKKTLLGFTSLLRTQNIWGWLNTITNKVDENRIKEVGPERAAAEWLLRCGAAVKWQGVTEKLTDYNSLPVGDYRRMVIEEIDATDSCIMSGLKHVKRFILHRCSYLDDEAVPQLTHLRDSLEHLQLSGCGNITDEGVYSIAQANLKSLKSLLLYDLPEVENRDKCFNILIGALPNCKVEFPYAQANQTSPTD